MRMLVWSLASLSRLKIWCCCELWCRPAAVALIRPLAWEPPYAVAAALEKAKRQKKKKASYSVAGPGATCSLDSKDTPGSIMLVPCHLLPTLELAKTGVLLTSPGVEYSRHTHTCSCPVLRYWESPVPRWKEPLAQAIPPVSPMPVTLATPSGNPRRSHIPAADGFTPVMRTNVYKM